MTHRDSLGDGNGRFRMLFLQPQPCIRTLKYAKGLKHVFGRRISISLAHMGQDLRTLYGYGEEYFDTITKKDGQSLSTFVSNAVEDSRPDIIHSHNAPDYLTIAATKISGDIPVIHDVHEVLSVHHSGFFSGDDDDSLSSYVTDERAAIEQSDGRIYATDGIRSYIQSKYRVKRNYDLVFPSYVSGKYLPTRFKTKLSDRDGEIHIAYVGCITSILRNSHYYLADIFRHIAKHKLHIHIHPTSNVITRSNIFYRQLASKDGYIHFHRHMNRRRLLNALTQYDYGWAGLNSEMNRKHLEVALPNKVFEYIVCGLPVLAFPHKTIMRFIQENGVGLIGENVDELAKQVADLDPSQLRLNVQRQRRNLTIEEKIPVLAGFYQRLIDRAEQPA